MIISCNECNSSFSVDDDVIKESGTKVRCSKCNSLFVAYPQPPEDEWAMDSEEQPLSSDEDLGLADIESSLEDFLDDDFEPENTGEAIIGDELPDLGDFEDLAGLDDESLIKEEADAELKDFELDLEADMKAGEEIAEAELEHIELDVETDMKAGEELAEAGIEDLELDLETDMKAGEELAEDGLEDFELDVETDMKAGAELAEAGIEDLELDLETDMKAGKEIDEAELEHLELDLETDIEAGEGLDEAGLEIEAGEELVAGGLEPEKDIPALEVESFIDSEDQNTSLGLDLEAEAQDGGEIAETGLEVEDAEGLDLSDFGLEMNDAQELDEASAGGAVDLELEQNLNQVAKVTAGSEETGADELDLSDLEKIIDQEVTPESKPQPNEALDDLDLELDLESEAPTGIEVSEPGDKAEAADVLDLSDLEEIMESDPAGKSQAPSDETAEDLGLDLDFQVGEGTQTADTSAELESDDELDFSDLEQMLESGDLPGIEAAAEKDEEELELQFDIEEQPAGGADISETADVVEAAEKDDFLDIEKMLEQGEDNATLKSAETENEELELPLEMEAAIDDASKGAESDLELDFDLESEVQAKEKLFENDVPADELLESNLLVSDERDYLDENGIEEAKFQDKFEQVATATEDLTTDEFGETEDAYGQTDVLPIDADELLETAAEPKSRSKKPVLVILLMLILATGIFTIPKMLGINIPYLSDIKIPYLDDLNLKIPYLSDFVSPEEQDVSGNLKMTPLDKTISSKYITNSRVGQLLVIRGKIKNEYDQPRSFVKVTGRLYQKGGKLAKTATVFCGNVLSDPELARMDIAAINKKMLNKFGDKRSNLKIKAGNMIPFMLVFDNLPQNLEEYTVEVTESSI